MKQILINYVRAGYPGLYILSHEEQRVEQEMVAVAKETKRDLFYWSCTDGLVNAKGESVVDKSDNPLVMLDSLPKLGEKSIVLLRDFHMFLDKPNPAIFRKFHDQLNTAKMKRRCIVVIGCQLKLPPELEKEITVIEHQLPDRDALAAILKTVADENEVHLNGNLEAIIDAAGGLTSIEAENAYALSVIEAKDIVPAIVAREKSNTVKKNGLLEIIETKTTLEDIGGLEILKSALHQMRNLFTKAAREYGIPTPRGQLIVGQAGTGKSLTARATASVFNLPLLKLEAGRLFGSLVGESESNWRSVHATCKAVRPCVLWIDEIDGVFSGTESSGKCDGGTTMRVTKAIMQDMQFDSEGIFYVFTANDIDNLPDPLVDRLDVWSVDLPNQPERESIWKITIEKYGRKSKNFDLAELAAETDGFSGRQLEQVWLKAMTLAFNAKREPTNKDAIATAATFVATSVLMADVIEKRRKRLANRAMSASAPETKATSRRKLDK